MIGSCNLVNFLCFGCENKNLSASKQYNGIQKSIAGVI